MLQVHDRGHPRCPVRAPWRTPFFGQGPLGQGYKIEQVSSAMGHSNIDHPEVLCELLHQEHARRSVREEERSIHRTVERAELTHTVDLSMKKNLGPWKNMNCWSVLIKECGQELIMNRGPAEKWAMKHRINVHNHSEKPTKQPFRAPKAYKNPL